MPRVGAYWFDPQNTLRQGAYTVVDAGLSYAATPQVWHRRLGLAGAFVLAVVLASGLPLQFETVLDPSFSYRSEDGSDGQARLPLQAAWARPSSCIRDRPAPAPAHEGTLWRLQMSPRPAATSRP